MNKVLFQLCRHCVDIIDGWRPCSASRIASILDLPASKVRYQLRKLKKDGYVDTFCGVKCNEDGFVFCLRGWEITEKAKDTKEYKIALAEERTLRKMQETF